jgi:hypothetical protein
VPLPTLVSVRRLADALDIPVNRIRALVDAGYLCTVPNQANRGGYRIVKSNPPDKIPERVVDRASVMLWLAGMDKGRTVPVFNIYIEKEIMRIAKLDEPFRTEQALKMLLRYRDAETIVEAVSKARSGDVAAAEIARLSNNYKRRLARMGGLEENPDGTVTRSRSRQRDHYLRRDVPPIRSSADRQAPAPSFPPVPSNGHSGLPRTHPPMVGR